MRSTTVLRSTAASFAIAGALFSPTAAANQFLLFPLAPFAALFSPYSPPAAAPSTTTAPGTETANELPRQFRRGIIDYRTSEKAGTVIIDTPNTYLYYVLGRGKAVRYGIGVGREGFTWSGVQTISRKAKWPDWKPPPPMLKREPYLPRFFAGGPHNPLGARAMYLGGTIYRIHGTNQPQTIGERVSSGCIRMTNEDVVDLYDRVKIGTKVIVLPISQRRADSNGGGRG